MLQSGREVPRWRPARPWQQGPYRPTEPPAPRESPRWTGCDRCPHGCRRLDASPGSGTPSDRGERPRRRRPRGAAHGHRWLGCGAADPRSWRGSPGRGKQRATGSGHRWRWWPPAVAPVSASPEQPGDATTPGSVRGGHPKAPADAALPRPVPCQPVPCRAARPTRARSPRRVRWCRRPDLDRTVRRRCLGAQQSNGPRIPDQPDYGEPGPGGSSSGSAGSRRRSGSPPPVPTKRTRRRLPPVQRRCSGYGAGARDRRRPAWDRPRPPRAGVPPWRPVP